MNLKDVLTLLQFLDDLFVLGGSLIQAAQMKYPELNMAPLPDLLAMDEARAEALKRTSGD